VGKALVAVGSVVAALTLTAGSAALAEYARDDSFDGDGLVTVGSDGGDYYNDVQPVDDGYVATGSWDGSRVVIAKHLEDGSLDPTFANDGRRVMDVGDYAYGQEVMPRPSGAFIVLVDTIRGFALVGINSDGSINRDFGERGYVKQGIRRLDLSLHATLDSEQRIVVAASESMADDFTASRLHVWRFGKGGDVDRSFSDGDLTASPRQVNDVRGILTDDEDRVWLVTAQGAKGSWKTAGGSLLRVPESGADVHTVRRFSVWRADGTTPEGIDQRDNGSFLIGLSGPTSARVGVIALDQRGRNVSGYGNAGVVRAECADLCYVFAQELDDNGALVLTGAVDDDASDRVWPADTWVARFTPGGHRDVDFMSGWERVFTLADGRDSAHDVAVDGEGRVLLAGQAGRDAMLLRLAELK
jgi:hypothetical protein